MLKHRETDIIFDWNVLEKASPLTIEEFELYDETLRDGIQSPTIVDPPIEKKLEIVHLMESLGIHYADIGLPGAGERAYAHTLRIAREIERSNLRLKPSCAARTHESDIRPIIEISEKVGRPIEVMAFIGSSPIRQLAEAWDLDRMLRMTADAADLAVKAGLPFTYVTEDTTRSRPDALDALFRTAINHGAQRVCLCDTVGHATPHGLRRLIQFTKDLIRGMGVDVGIDWHGHNDRGLALTNTIRALEAGATRVHGTALGVGERVGNASMDQLILNLKLLGEIDWDVSNLIGYCESVAEAFQTAIPFNYPLVGRDAFRTVTGVHASAVIKAAQIGDAWLADRVYSGVPAGLFARSQVIGIGHMSGASNVASVLKSRGIEPTSQLVEHILKAAKASDRTLTDADIDQLIAEAS